jgi:hypothetical protein
MGNVIQFPQKESYCYRMNGLDIVITSNCGRLVIDPNLLSISISGEILTFESRAAMAQILNAASIMIDSEGRWKDGEYPALNY